MQSTYDKIQYYKLGQKEKRDIIAKLKALLAKEEQVKIAWVFGSFTRQGSIRDIDVAIYSQPEFSFKEFLNINAELELELHLPVDLVEIARVSEDLKDNILTSGVPVKGAKKHNFKSKTKLQKLNCAYTF